MNRPIKSIILLVILIIFFFASLSTFIFSVKEKIVINNNITKTLATIKEYTQTGKDPVLMRLANLLSQRLTFGEKYKKLKSALNTSTARTMPVKLPDAIKFKEQLYQAHQHLKNLAANAGASLPGDIGFNQFHTHIPTVEQLPILVKQLDAVDETVKLLIKADIKRIDSIGLLEPTDKRIKNPQEVVYKELPIKVTVECATENLIRFLYGLRTSEFIFVVRNLKIDSTSTQPGIIKTELEICSIILL